MIWMSFYWLVRAVTPYLPKKGPTMLPKQPDQTHTRDTTGYPAFPDPNNPLLKNSRYAPHETGAVLRAQRVGYSGLQIAGMFRMSPYMLMAKIRSQLNAEQQAAREGRDIHDGQVKPR